jgi:GH25 family lysozyme M1 (1,4-beta-N-acetylmuramidase)
LSSATFAAGACDQPWLQRLAATSQFLPQRMSLFLVEHFFNVRQGRALILQPARRIGYFYLKPEIHDRAELLAAEIKQFLDLFALLARLRADRLLYLLGRAQAEAQMVFVGDLFEHPKPAREHVLLNARGDYTHAPEAIQDAADNVIYKGVLLDGEVFDLVASCVHGIFYLTEDSRAQLLATAPVQAATPPPVPGGPAAAGEPAAAPDAGGGPAPGWSQRARPWALLAAGAALVAALAWQGLPWRKAPAPDAAVPGAAPRAAPPAPSPAAVPAAPAPGAAPRTPPGALPDALPDALPGAPGPAPEKASLSGIDISRWNAGAGVLLREKRIAFAFARASYGLSVDPSFASHWTALRQGPLARGAYHVFSYRSDPALQADKFAAQLGAPGPRDLCPAVDFEEGSLPSRTSAPPVAQVRQALLSHLVLLEKKVGCTPILYTNREMGNRYLDDPLFSRYPLWIADWTVGAQAPALPVAWARTGHRFWQKSASYEFADARRDPTDLDVFAGSGAELALLYRAAAPPRPPAPSASRP